MYEKVCIKYIKIYKNVYIDFILISTMSSVPIFDSISLDLQNIFLSNIFWLNIFYMILS